MCLSGVLWTFLRKVLSLLLSYEQRVNFSLWPVCYGGFALVPSWILSLTVARLSCIFLSEAGSPYKDPFPKNGDCVLHSQLQRNERRNTLQVCECRSIH